VRWEQASGRQDKTHGEEIQGHARRLCGKSNANAAKQSANFTHTFNFPLIQCEQENNEGHYYVIFHPNKKLEG
jgi:hypothetical protein